MIREMIKTYPQKVEVSKDEIGTAQVLEVRICQWSELRKCSRDYSRARSGVKTAQMTRVPTAQVFVEEYS